MSLWQSLGRLLNPARSMVDQTFSLGDRGTAPAAEESAPERLALARASARGVVNHIDSLLAAAPAGKHALKKAGDLSASLEENVRRLKQLFRMPENKDLIVRELRIATQPPTRAVVCFMEGLSDKTTINESILQPLMLLSHLDHHQGREGEDGPTHFSVRTVLDRLLPGNQATEQYEMNSVAQSLLAGDSVLMFEGIRTAVAVETKGFPTRSVGEPKNEQTVWGARDAFTEAWRVNVALVRRRLKDPRVTTEILTVGELSHTYVGMMYVDAVVSPKLVAEVKRRVESLKVDVIGSAGVLEQFIEDQPSALLPGTLVTERPDRAAAYLAEGHVLLFVDNSPHAIVCPVTFWALLQTAEDYNLRFPFATLLRYLRLGALLFALLVPAFFIAVINYHQEMLPTDLMLFIASTRVRLPLPAVVELIGMDVAFELIREASVRIPGVIGPTMGLVASLVLGQAAVAAKIVSPIMIIIVALTGLASFAIPSYLAGFGIRLLRFALLAGAMTMGFYGIGAVAFVLVIHMAGMRSFGVPYLSPISPGRAPVADVLIRPHLYQMELRPSYMRPVNRRRQPEIVRKWDPAARKQSDGSDGDKGGKPS